MKHRNLGKFIVAAASISMALSPISALAKPATAVLADGETTATVDTKALLKDAITYAKAQDTTDVVPAVTTNLTAKIKAAETVRDKADATVDEINAAWSALVDAVHYLDFKGNPTALDTLVTEARKLNEADYESGWDAFKTALTAAENALADENTLQDDLDAKKAALETAISGLVAVKPIEVDKTELKAALDQAAAKNEADYTEESWGVLEEAVAAGQAVYDKADATQTEVDAAKAQILTAIDGLKDKETPVVVDKTALNKAIADAGALNAADYTEESWAALDTAVNAGKAVAAKEDATQAEVDAATKAITDAIDGLKNAETPVVVDKAALKAQIDAAGKLNKADYTEESWAALEAALAKGEDVYADENAEQGAVNEAANAIKQAINGLVKVDIENPVDKTELADALKANKELAENEPEGDESLNPETYGAFKKAYEAADAVNKDEDATQEAVDKAVADLKAAYADLDQIMYRVYNPNNGEHLFTANKKEYDHLSKIGWNGEDIAWIAPKASLEGATAMTRMYDKNSGEHHYTKNEKEIKALEDLGWTNEGKKWATAAKNENVIHRLYNPNETRAGRHHYTLNDKEKDHLDSIGWNWEHSESDLIYAKAPAPEKK